MLDIPKPPETTTLKITVKKELVDDLKSFVEFVQGDQPHASFDQVVEYMLEQDLGRSTKVMKAYRAWKEKMESRWRTSEAGEQAAAE